jgi:hypothetical protein
MRALLIIVVLIIAAGQYEPLVYEGFEVNVKTGYGNKPEMISRTCMYFSGHTLIKHQVDGEYQFSCPRRRGQISTASPGLIVD